MDLQRTPEWLAKRAGKFTASRANDLMARTKTGPAASRKNLIATLAVERITGSCEATYQNGAMLRGIEMEAEARAAYSFEKCVAVEERDFIDHAEIPMCGCSPDGLVGDDGMLELKCPSAMAKHLEALETGAHADEYRWQLQHQLMVTGRKWVDAVSYDPRYPEEMRLAIRRVERDETAIAELIEAIAKAEAEVSEKVASLKHISKRSAA